LPRNLETEVKLAVRSAEEAASLLRRHGFRIIRERTFEANEVFDWPSGILRTRNELLRLREFAGEHTLTYKGPPEAGPHKSREEIESRLENASNFRLILSRLGFSVGFRYEKYRSEWERPGDAGHVTLDETPIGGFFELEGEPQWIDRTAAELGFDERDYITASYSGLYHDHCTRHGIHPTHMVF
jgi:adenylate cyclase, class 2